MKWKVSKESDEWWNLWKAHRADEEAGVLFDTWQQAFDHAQMMVTCTYWFGEGIHDVNTRLS